jgi:hypothetical protein
MPGRPASCLAGVGRDRRACRLPPNRKIPYGSAPAQAVIATLPQAPWPFHAEVDVGMRVGSFPSPQKDMDSLDPSGLRMTRSWLLHTPYLPGGWGARLRKRSARKPKPTRAII